MFFIFLYVTLFQTGCVAAKNDFRAFIDKSPEWEVVEKCGYEGCYPLVDVITGKEVSMRAELNNHIKEDYFMIITSFTKYNNASAIDTSKISVKFDGREVITKTFPCSNPNRQSNYLKEEPSLNGSIKIKQTDCLLVYVDNHHLSNGEEVILDINDAFTVNRKNIGVPTIYFKKNRHQ